MPFYLVVQAKLLASFVEVVRPSCPDLALSAQVSVVHQKQDLVVVVQTRSSPVEVATSTQQV